MHQNLAIKRPLIIVRHHQARRQIPPVQRHAVDQVELERPGRLALWIQPVRRAGEAEIKLDGQVPRLLIARALAGGFAEEFPPGRPGETVLREGGGLSVTGGRGPEDGEDEGDAASDGLGAVKLGG